MKLSSGLIGVWLLVGSTGQATARAAAPVVTPTAETFVDRAAEWGLSFKYETGASGKFYYPEIIGGGAALFDYDGDGDLDVFFVQGRPLAPGAPGPVGGGRLFRNDLIAGSVRRAEPRFVDVTAASGIRADGYGMGVAAGDYDGDGRVDLLVLNFGPDQLWRNRGDGTFEDVTKKAGLADDRMSLSASFADLDRDGRLDLYIANYVDFSVARNPTCFAPSSRRDYCGPTAYPPAPDRLLRNRGNGVFEDVSLPSGIGRRAGRSMGVVAADFDGDGWADVFVANDGMENFLWRNRRDGTFEEVALPAGVALDGEGRALANMGVAAGDPDEDGDLDLYVTHLAGETDTLWANDGAGTFRDVTARAGLAAPGLATTGFGTGFLDYDNDGRLDLFAANGEVSLSEEQAQRGSPFPYAQPRQMFHNVAGAAPPGGGLRFAEVSREMGADFARPEVGRGVAFGDVDEDGDTDVLVVNAEGPARLLVNQVGNAKLWIGLRLLARPAAGERTGKAGAAGRPVDAAGALVQVMRKGAPPLRRRAATDGSFASASDPRVLVGLGEASEIAEVRVTWPDGRAESFPPPPLRAYTALTQGTGRAVGAPSTL